MSMTDLSDDAPHSASIWPNLRLGPAFLIYFHIVVCCLSLIYVAEFYANIKVVMFDQSRLYAAALNILPIALASILFALSRFSFGYFLGFYLYSMILGYVWLVAFSRFNYDHALATISAFGSVLAFLVPALFITLPIRQTFILSVRTFENLLSFILILAAVIVAVGAFYNFRLIGIADIYSFRDALHFPTWLAYAMGATSSALLPFAFACFVMRGQRWRAALVLALLLLFYPVTLTKLMLFAPVWLLLLTLLCRFFEARTSIVLSLFLPLSIGVLVSVPIPVRLISVRTVQELFRRHQLQHDSHSIQCARLL